MLTTNEAATRLGVKPETLYAYVSRGQLSRHHTPDGRRSLFARAEIERLAARGHRGGRASALELVGDTELTLLDPAGRLLYRGRDATELAGGATYEEVAELLWGGEHTARRWISSGPFACAAARPADALRIVVALAAAADPLRCDLRPAAVRHTARGLIAAMVDSLPQRSAPAGDSIAARLWSRLHHGAPTEPQVRAVDAALILLADHELALSALAARVAASAHADPYLVVLAGLAAQGGALHGAAGTAVEKLFAEIATVEDVPRVIGERLPDGLPGFGHAVYTDHDPRATTLLALIEPDEIVQAVLETVGRHDGPFPNVDLALGAMTHRFGFMPGSAEAIFAIARTAGLIAHALEEYPYRLRFRARAAYVGPKD
jgi:citrate synthase